VGFSYSRNKLGDPSLIAEQLGELEVTMLGGFGFGQSFEPVPIGVSRGPRVVEKPNPENISPSFPVGDWKEKITPPSHILVPLDGSGFAEQALLYAEALGLAYNARLLLLSVPQARQLIRSIPIYGKLPEPGTTEWEAQEIYLSEVAERVNAMGIQVDTLVQTGSVTDAINDLVEERGVDMVVLSTRGRSGLQRMVLGSVATQVVQGVTRPILIVRPIDDVKPPLPEFKKLLVTLDGSEFAERVLPYVRASTSFESEVLLLAVPQVPRAERYGAVVEEIQELRQQAEQEAGEYLECVAAALQEDGIEAHVLVCGSRPADTIISVAKEEDVDVVMMATHGHGELDRLFLGSVADRIVQNTHCPVFLVPIRERRQNGIAPD
jgi:nucleotide-binding universal stress UspA family protein